MKHKDEVIRIAINFLNELPNAWVQEVVVGEGFS